MNKGVLISIQPQWCEKIFNGEKTIEVRRTRPKIETPFTVYVYCTKAKNIREDGLYLLPNDKELYLGCKEKDLGFVCWEGDFRNGKVIGSFVCDKIEKIEFRALCMPTLAERSEVNRIAKQACLTIDEMRGYLNGDNGYGWHITEPKLFDKPRELGEFRKSCGLGTGCEDCDDIYFMNCKNKLTRPPKSFVYVEELENE